jgi:hypothetical protein
MPYVLKRGTIYGQPYKVGDFVPGEKGSLADMEEAGAVEWVETKKIATPEPELYVSDKDKTAAKRTPRKAVK